MDEKIKDAILFRFGRFVGELVTDADGMFTAKDMMETIRDFLNQAYEES